MIATAHSASINSPGRELISLLGHHLAGLANSYVIAVLVAYSAIAIGAACHKHGGYKGFIIDMRSYLKNGDNPVIAQLKAVWIRLWLGIKLMSLPLLTALVLVAAILGFTRVRPRRRRKK